MAESGLILLYHGVTDQPADGIENCQGKHLPLAEFEDQMRLVAQTAFPMTLRDMAGRLAAGRPLPPRAVAVTFDDDYANVHALALPTLRRHQVPATFFLTTGFVGTSRLYWTDLAEHCVNRTRTSALRLTDPAWAGDYELDGPAGRMRVLGELKARLKALPPGHRDRCLAELTQASGVRPDQGHAANYAHLDWDQVRELDDPPHYEVGGHTVNHEILAYLDDEALERETGGCLDALRRELGRPVDLFSYPEGQENHFDDRVIAALRRRGVSICPTALAGTNPPGTDPFHLRRVMVGFQMQPFPLAPLPPYKDAT